MANVLTKRRNKIVRRLEENAKAKVNFLIIGSREIHSVHIINILLFRRRR